MHTASPPHGHGVADREAPASASEETFHCDGEDCGRVLPLRLLRRGAAVLIGGSIYCPRCRIRVVGARKRKIDLVMVATVLVVALVFPLTIGVMLSTNKSDREKPWRAEPSGPPPLLPDLAARQDPLASMTREDLREEIASALREFLREEALDRKDLDPPRLPPREHGLEHQGSGEDRGGPPHGTGALVPNRIGPETASTDLPAAPRVDLAELDSRIDEAVRKTLLDRFESPPKAGLAETIDDLAAIRVAGRDSWGEPLAVKLAILDQDEFWRGLASVVLREIGARSEEPPPRDPGVDWNGATERARRVLRKENP